MTGACPGHVAALAVGPVEGTRRTPISVAHDQSPEPSEKRTDLGSDTDAVPAMSALGLLTLVGGGHWPLWSQLQHRTAPPSL